MGCIKMQNAHAFHKMGGTLFFFDAMLQTACLLGYRLMQVF